MHSTALRLFFYKRKIYWGIVYINKRYRVILCVQSNEFHKCKHLCNTNIFITPPGSLLLLSNQFQTTPFSAIGRHWYTFWYRLGLLATELYWSGRHTLSLASLAHCNVFEFHPRFYMYQHLVFFISLYKYIRKIVSISLLEDISVVSNLAVVNKAVMNILK